MNSKEVMAYLKISRRTLQNWIKSERLKPIKVNPALIKSPYVFSREQVESLNKPA